MILQIYEKNQIQQPTIEKKSHPQMRISDSNKSQQTHNKHYRQQMTICLIVAFFYIPMAAGHPTTRLPTCLFSGRWALDSPTHTVQRLRPDLHNTLLQKRFQGTNPGTDRLHVRSQSTPCSTFRHHLLVYLSNEKGRNEEEILEN